MANVYNWSALNDGDILGQDTVTPFDPATDTLLFDDTIISAAEVDLDSIGTDSIFTFDGKTVTLFSAAPYTLTTANISFADGSVLIVGDNTTGTVDDDNANTIVGGAGDDQLIGAGGADVVEGLGGNDRLFGDEGDDTLSGGSGNDTLDGGTGDDTMNGGAGADSLAGGADVDTLDYSDSPARVIVNLFNMGTVILNNDTVSPGTAVDGFGFTDTVSGFENENVIGSAFNDYIQGATNVANRLEGGDGNDTLAGSGQSESIPGAMDDTLLGGADNDVLRQSRGNDSIDGGTGVDRLDFFNNGIVYGGTTAVNVDLSAGTSNADANDTDTVNGGGGDIATISSIESVFGTSGNDTFTGGNLEHAPGVENGQAELFRPMGGDDIVTGMAGRGWITTVEYSSNSSGQAVNVVLGNGDNIGSASDGLGGTDVLINVDQVFGSPGNDVLTGGSYATAASGTFIETFRGNAGNDTIDGQGADTVLGAHGVLNRVDYVNSLFGVVVNIGTAAIEGDFYGAGVVTVSGGTALDGFSSTGGGTDTLFNINSVRGSNFNDTLVASDSGDRLEGRAGDDSLVGGLGNDEADYSFATSAVVVDIAAGTASDGQGGTDTLVSIEWARGGDFNDTLTGGANAIERLQGGVGDDYIDGGSMTGVNFATFTGAGTAASAFVENGSGTALDGQGGTDTLVNINGLIGTGFDDTLAGGTGEQWFQGRGGSDAIDGGADNDWVDYSSDPNGVTVNLATSTATDGWGGVWDQLGTDTLTSIENVQGSDFADDITGDDNDNTIVGGAGDDQLIGAGGADTIFGGGGNDVFGIVGADADGIYGDDTLNGGSGSQDRIVYFEAVAGVTVSLGNETAAGSASGGDDTAGGGSTLTLFGIEAATGTEFADTFNANSEVQVNGLRSDIVQRFEGAGGDDTINGTAGNSRNTIIEYQSAAQGVIVNLGPAQIVVGAETVLGGTARDGLGGTDTLNNIDGVTGSGHDDVLVGGGAALGISNTLIEFFEGMAGNDTINGASDQDEVRYDRSPGSVNVTLGGLGNGTASDGWGFTDTLIGIERARGSEFNDTLTGSSQGGEQFEGRGGDDFIDGGGGFDRIRFRLATGGVAVNMGTGDFDLADYGLGAETIAAGTGQGIGDDSIAGIGVDTFINIEGARGTDFNDVLVGGANHLNGFNNRQQYEGDAGNDTFDGGDISTDSFDVLSYVRDPSGVIVNLGNDTIIIGAETLAGATARDGFGVNGNEAGIDTLININGVEGSDFDDTLVGGDANEWFGSRFGDDYVDAGGGNDTILGSEGRDTALGGAGDDLFSGSATAISGLRTDARQAFEGGAGNDTLNGATGDGLITVAEYRGAGGGVIVNLGTTQIVMAGETVAGGAAQGIGDDSIAGIGVDKLTNVDGVVGSAYDDVLVGGGPSRSIGGGLNERFEGLAGDDTISGGNGGNGVDSADYEESPDSVVVNLSLANVVIGAETVAGGTALDGWGGVDTLINVERARGSDYNDTFIGGAGDERFEGMGGDDSFDGGGGFDLIRYFLATGAVSVDLGAGTAQGIGGDNGIGADTFVNIVGALGSDFDDVLAGGGEGMGAENFYAEVFEGLAGNDTLDGGDADTASLDYVLYERSSTGAIVNLGATPIVAGSDTIAGGTARDGHGVNGNEHGIDTLININGVIGSRFNDTLVGGAADETFEGMGGNDSIVGGGGVDTLDYIGAFSPVIVNLDPANTLSVGADTVQPNSARDGFGGTDAVSGIENVIGSNFDDFIRGSNAANLIDGGAGNDILLGGHQAGDSANDTLLGGDGDDVIRQSRGADSMDGGDGYEDRLVFNNPSGTNTSTNLTYASGVRGVNVNLGAGTSDYDTADDTNPGGTVVNIENVWGTAGDDILTGGSAVRANSGNLREVFRGGEGNDTIDGVGGGGLDGFGYIDRVEYGTVNDIPPAAGVIVNLGATTFAGVAGGTARDSFGDIDTLININHVAGTGLNDSLIGGDPGLDEFERFQGNGGNDYINGGAGMDEVSYQNASGAVNVNLGTGIATGADGTDTLLNIERARGGNFADVLTGSNRLDVHEVFVGEVGNDTINGGAGIDFASWQPTGLTEGGLTAFIQNGSGTVTHLTKGTDTLINIEGLVGTNSNDSLTGGAGDQWFRGRGGSDTLTGGAGIDTADYSTDRGAVIVNLATGTATDGWGGVWNMGGTDKLVTIENVLGSTFNDRITGSGDTLTGANLLDGNFGNDTLEGGAGNDTLDGGAGNDSLLGGAGEDTFIDKVGNDTLNGGTEDDTFLVNYTGGTVTATGGAGGDTYVLNPAATGYTYKVTDFALTGISKDFIDVGALLDKAALAGFYSGQDPFAAGFLKFVKVGLDKVLQWDLDGTGAAYGFVDVLTLVGKGNAAITAASLKGLVVGSVSPDALVGGAEDDILLGLGGNDTLSGGGGDDLLFGGIGVDSMIGGAGNDTYQVDSLSDKVVETTNTPGALLLPGADASGAFGPGLLGVEGITDTVISAINYSLASLGFVENVVLTGTASSATGNALANVLTGNTGNDTLVGAGGNDTLDGGAGADSMAGGAGNDFYVVDAAGDFTTELAAQGTDTVQSSVAHVLGVNLEHLVLTGVTNLNGTGNALANQMTGNSGKNLLTGDVGNDTLDGGGGIDTLVGGVGNDLFIVDVATDVVTELAAGGVDTIQSSVTRSLAGTTQVENLVLTGGGGINGTGNALANQITGNGADNVLNGGAGNDTLKGGTGNDTYVVDVAGDVVTELANQGVDTIQSSLTRSLAATAQVENLVLTGAGTIDGTGNGLANTITGNGVSNILNGGAGDDTLDGGAGDDTLVWDAFDSSINGGAGEDTLRVDGIGTNIDLTTIPNTRIQNVEIVDLDAVTVDSNHALTLLMQDVLDLSSTTDTLRVDGNAGDFVYMGTGWTTGVDEVIGPNTYHKQTIGLATLLVDTDITILVTLP